jgi:hypothetical protein
LSIARAGRWRDEYAENERLRAALLNIQAAAERGWPIDHAKIATQCRLALDPKVDEQLRNPTEVKDAGTR